MKKDIKINNLKFGDIVFIDDRSTFNLLGNVIRYVQTGGKININYFCPAHCMVVYEENEDINKVKIIHATSFKVKVTKLNRWLNKRKVNLIVKRYKGELRYKEAMKQWLAEQIGKWYDVPALFGIYGRYFLLRYSNSRIIRWYLRGKQNPLASKKRFVCSKLVFNLYLLKARIRLWLKCDGSNVTPYDIYRSTKLKEILRVFNYRYREDK